MQPQSAHVLIHSPTVIVHNNHKNSLIYHPYVWRWHTMASRSCIFQGLNSLMAWVYFIQLEGLGLDIWISKRPKRHKNLGQAELLNIFYRKIMQFGNAIELGWNSSVFLFEPLQAAVHTLWIKRSSECIGIMWYVFGKNNTTNLILRYTQPLKHIESLGLKLQSFQLAFPWATFGPSSDSPKRQMWKSQVDWWESCCHTFGKCFATLVLNSLQLMASNQ